jgi:hypothetical protein
VLPPLEVARLLKRNVTWQEVAGGEGNRPRPKQRKPSACPRRRVVVSDGAVGIHVLHEESAARRIRVVELGAVQREAGERDRLRPLS